MSDKIEKWIENNFLTIEFLNEVPDAIYICNEEGKIIFTNKAAEEGDKLPLEEIRGKSISTIYGVTEANSLMLSTLKYKKKTTDLKGTHWRNREKVLHASAFPIVVEDECIGVFCLEQDITNTRDILEQNILLQKKLSDIEKSGKKEENHNTLTLLGEDPQFIESKIMATRAAKTDSTVMLVAETGCGKDLFAKFIHNMSDRKHGPFLALNCAAIPETLIESMLFGTAKGAYTGAVEREGLFKQAEGGTLFLDEINSMPLASQAKFLRVLEDKIVHPLGSQKSYKTNVRIISSCNSNIWDAVENRELREDLLYRLAVINIIIPPLTQRKEDILLLANSFISDFNQAFNKHIIGLDDATTALFLNYTWPGNVRQLKHCIESAMNFVEKDEYYIRQNHLPPYITTDNTGFAKQLNKNNVDTEPLNIHFSKKSEYALTENLQERHNTIPTTKISESIKQRQKEEIIQALIDAEGNVSKAARNLNINRHTLIYRMKKYNIE